MTSRLGTTLTAIGVLVLAATPVLAQDRPGEGTSIKMARPSWDTGWFQTEVYSQMLEELGYTVGEPMTLDNPAFYQSVAYGDVTMWVDGWFPLHNNYAPAFEGQAEIVGAVAVGGATEGYLIDKASAERLGITSLEDFKRDEVKAAFDRNGDGKADMVACPPGWMCEVVIEHHLQEYDLLDHINPINASYPASIADAIAAYQNGESILFYTWAPNWTVHELMPGEDVVWIEVPHISLPADLVQLADAAARSGVEGCVNDPCQLGFPASDIVPVVNSAFLNDNPAVRALLEAAQMPVGDINAQNAVMNAGDTDIKKHAAEWIAENRAQVDEWLAAARAAAS